MKMELINRDEVLFQRLENLNEKQKGREDYNKGWNDAVACYSKIIKNLSTTYDLNKFLKDTQQLLTDCFINLDDITEEGDKE